MVNESRYGVDRHPVSGRWAVYEHRPDGSIAWVDQGWRDSADAEQQRLNLEGRMSPRTRTVIEATGAHGQVGSEPGGGPAHNKGVPDG